MHLILKSAGFTRGALIAVDTAVMIVRVPKTPAVSGQGVAAGAPRHTGGKAAAHCHTGVAQALLVTRGSAQALVVTQGAAQGLVATQGAAQALVATQGAAQALVVTQGPAQGLIPVRLLQALQDVAAAKDKAAQQLASENSALKADLGRVLSERANLQAVKAMVAAALGPLGLSPRPAAAATAGALAPATTAAANA